MGHFKVFRKGGGGVPVRGSFGMLDRSWVAGEDGRDAHENRDEVVCEFHGEV
jgi:hypothetical protein